MSKVYKRILTNELTVNAREATGLSPLDTVTCETLRDLLFSRGLTKKMNVIIGTLIAEENLWEEAIILSRDNNPKIAFRASWALEWAYTMNSEQIERRFEELLNDFSQTDNESVQRVYSKMLCDMIRRRVIYLSDEKAAAIAETCFDLLTNRQTPVAVKVWQIELLADLSQRIEWIEENLTDIVRDMSENSECTPAIAASARRFLKLRNKK